MRQFRLVGVAGLLIAGIILQASVALAGMTTHNGVLEPGDTTFTGRIFRDGTPSTCESPKTYPGLFENTGERFYDSYTITNWTASTQCVTVTLDVAGGLFFHSTAYLGSFDPTNFETNFLADSGFSASPGAPATYSFNLEAGQAAVIVVFEANASGSTPQGYTLTIDGELGSQNPTDLIAALKAQIRTTVPNNVYRTQLMSYMDQAQVRVDLGQKAAAAYQIDQFMMRVQMYRGTAISAELADSYLAQAGQIKVALGFAPAPPTR